MSTVKLYVTKWVLARGILVFSATLRSRDRGHKDQYQLKLSGQEGFRHSLVNLGTGAFLTLEEAQEDAEWRFRKAAEDLALAAQRAAKGLQLAEAKQILIHHDPPRIKTCRPYEGYLVLDADDG